MTNVSIFDLMEQSKAGVVAKVEETKVEETKVTETKIEEPKVEDTKTENTKTATTNKKSKKDAPKTKTDDETKEEKLKEFTSIEVKVFGTTIMTISEESEIQKINLSNIRNSLIEMGYQELRGNVSWLIIPDSDNLGCILTIIPAFQNKG